MDIINYCLGRHRKSSLMKDYRFMMYYIELWSILMSQFEYRGLPDSVPAEWVEAILITNGTVGIGEYNDTLYAARGSYQGNLNGYIPQRYVASIPSVDTIDGDADGPAAYDISGEPGRTIVVGWNNAGHFPEMDLIDTVAALCEGRTSEEINVIFSRLLRIPIARNQKEKDIIESAIKAIIEGRVEAVTSELKGLEDILDGQQPRQFLDLVDVKDVDKLQYLNQYMDNVYKRFMRRHGISLNITNKLAQQTNAEMHGADDYAMIYPLQQLKYRREMIDSLNSVFGEKYGFHATVDFSKMWKNSFDRVVNYVPDELNEKTIIENVDDNNISGGDNNGKSANNSENIKNNGQPDS